MAERKVDLQTAVNILTDMLADRVQEYAALKKKLPSFGAEIDARLAVYHENLEHFVQKLKDVRKKHNFADNQAVDNLSDSGVSKFVLRLSQTICKYLMAGRMSKDDLR